MQSLSIVAVARRKEQRIDRIQGSMEPRYPTRWGHYIQNPKRSSGPRERIESSEQDRCEANRTNRTAAIRARGFSSASYIYVMGLESHASLKGVGIRISTLVVPGGVCESHRSGEMACTPHCSK